MKLKGPKERKVMSISTWVTWMVRKASYRWPPRNEAVRDAKVAPNTFRCAGCNKHVKKQKIGRRSSISADHIIPIKDPTKPGAFQDALLSCACGVCDFLRKMFCDKTGFQMLCMECHDEKTFIETGVRKEARRKKKLGTDNGEAA